MFKTITIGEKEVELVATASTPIRMRQIFGVDLMRVFSKAEEDGGVEMADVIPQLAYVMNCQAKKMDMTKLNMNTFVEWCDEFGAMDLVNASAQIIEVYTGNSVSKSISKKNNK